MTEELKKFIEGIPKAELHLHIEGSFEPELMFEIAQRNKQSIKYNSVEEVRQAYNFSNLQDFLDIYYAGAGVLLYEQDFYDLTWAYLERAKANNILHTEIMFDPQTHTDRGVEFNTVFNGIYKALKDGEEKLGITFKIIFSFLRHLSEEACFEVYEHLLDNKDRIDAIGLDSSEVGNPPSKFERIYKRAKADGFFLTAHAGEEGPAEYVWEALDILQVDRIDHGNHSLDDEKLVERLVKEQIALTVCPLSNLKLRVVKDMKEHPLKTMLEKGLFVTVNSDDPAYFGGYVNDNFIAVADALDLTKEDIYKLAKNSFMASNISQEEKEKYVKLVDDYYNANA